MNKCFFLILILLLNNIVVFADTDLRTMFLNNDAVICGINIRNFNSDDKNGNGIIEKNETRGNFLNAIERLDEIQSLGINTLHVLPITPTGKLKALGTAGSLYAISDFTSINDQLIDKTSELKAVEQAKLFTDECHRRGIKVIIDLPSCGSYDLFLKNPELFLKDEMQMSVVPTDWTDVRLFNTGNNSKLNDDLLAIHKNFADMVLAIGVDGIRADVATIKPSKFWEEFIKYTRSKNPNFLFLAEASDSWREPPSVYAVYTPYDKLLEAGFDGYYGSFFNLKDWKNSADLYEHVKFNKKLLSSYDDKKSVILSFTTHDEVSPIHLHGVNFSEMICWLDATLPFNPYIIDGFTMGADYIYPLENSKAIDTETDDDFYFVHRGKLDIFNFTAKPTGKYIQLADEFRNAMKFRASHIRLISSGSFIPLKTQYSEVFAYARCYDSSTLVVIGNLNHKTPYKKVKIKVPKINKAKSIEYIKGDNLYKIRHSEMYTNLKEGEIRVLLINNFSL